MAEELQVFNARPSINSLPTEIFEMIILAYSTVSINLQCSGAMNFLVVCKLWAAVGQSCQHSFRFHLVISGHDELVQLFDLYQRRMIPSGIKSLTVNLAPTYAGDGLRGSVGLVPAMVQIQKDLDEMRWMFIQDWVVPQDVHVCSYWKTLNLDHFSLYVDLSAVSAQKPLLRGWIRHWVYRVDQNWREMGWKGGDRFSGSGLYSYWNR